MSHGTLPTPVIVCIAAFWIAILLGAAYLERWVSFFDIEHWS